ncbi:MAG: hypothetical protein AABY27_05495, partial [Pseudomonadota bacterium]
FTCGGCSLQHLKHYSEYKYNLVKNSLENIEFEGELHDLFQVSHNTRRRVSFRVKNKLGFSKFQSNEIIEIDNCLLLENEINNLITPINQLINRINIKLERISITSSDTGIEIVLVAKKKTNLECDILISEFANKYNIAKIALQINDQLPFSLIERKPVQLLFDGVQVDLPINSFLQVSKESLSKMTKIILQHVEMDKKILEFYCGVGSFTIPLSQKTSVYAFEGSIEAIEALNKASKIYKLPIYAETRDLYQNPVQVSRINDFSQVLINPPRNGATPQIKQLSQSSSIKTLILVSCSLSNFIRDAKILINTGMKLTDLYPIDHFLYTEHIEIIGVFKR